jgi:hypothetical protein
MHGSMRGYWGLDTVGLVRHRQPKEAETDRPDLPSGLQALLYPCRSELLEFVEGGFQFVARTPVGEDTVKPYPGVDDLVGPAVRVRMPRAANPVPQRLSVGRRAGHA